MKLGPTQRWVKEKEKEEVLVVGDPVKAAVRCKKRVIEEPVEVSKPEGKKQERQVWYSHDLPCTGRAKMWPAQGGGERFAISWSKRLSAEECAKRAANIKKPEPEKDAGMGEPAMGEPGMEEPGMDGGMEEPGMGEPGKEPGMDEPGMDAGMGG
jgi:hypothetical protein